MRRFLKLAGGVVAVLVLVFVGSVGWIWHQVNASVASYDGELAVTGLSAPVTVTRDSLGVVTIRAGNQLDEARALGFVHAQERFFQMDLLRRSAAGELAALFGTVAIGADERRRVHLMRATAEQVIAAAPDDYRALLDAYTDGVNAGLTALGAKPPEYLLLRTDPEPWVPADSVLAVAAMFFDLQGGTALHKRNELVARSILPPAIGDFLYPSRTSWDAPLVGTAASPAGVPESGVYDLRTLPAELFGPAEDLTEMPAPIGSNNWAVAGAHTANGRGLVANDMHLGLGVPSIWFRASLERGEWRLTGVSLPGTPLIIAGSNGHVAWGFTNSYGDWLDLIVLELHPDNPNLYRTPDGWVAFETVDSPIAVARGDARDFEVKRTLWGPVMGELPDGRPYVVRWTAHEPEAYAPGFMALVAATNVAEALAAAQRSGIPAQNFVVADEYGDIAWTIMGRIPARVRGGGVSHSADGPAWDGWLAPEDYPVVYNPSLGRVWTANARVVDGGALELVGDGGYALGARGRQIRDRLLSVAEATPADMLAIQLDDEALFLARWRELLLAQLDEVAVGADPRFGAVRDAVLAWGGHAAVDSVGYRLVRGWRIEMIDRMLSALAAEVRAVDGSWRYIGFRSEEWAWPVASTEPAHLLDPQYESWRVFKLAALAALLDELDVVSAPQVSQKRWGGRNAVRVRHPLSRAVPALSEWLDMPAVALPGDSYMPRVQSPTFGASERFAVSPGDEANGYFHMPGGQSGHPRSPFYGAGHDDWAAGRPTPFLPGDPVHTLTLVPPVGGTSTVVLPSGAGAVAPNLAPARDGGVWLSWIEPVADGHALKFAHRATDGAWSEARTIAQGADWFVNWADFPAIAETADGVLVAHWLQKSGPDVYAYDVMVTRSTDGGATWSAPDRPHADRTRFRVAVAARRRFVACGLARRPRNVGRSRRPRRGHDDAAHARTRRRRYLGRGNAARRLGV